MPLITMNIPESLGNSITELLTRIAVSLERIAGPVIEYRPPTQSTLRDYAHVPPETAAAAIDAQAEFAAAHMLVPGSPAYLLAIESFERDVAAAYGEDAVGRLPWRVPTSNPPGATGSTGSE